jgi:hypothetical protein
MFLRVTSLAALLALALTACQREEVPPVPAATSAGQLAPAALADGSAQASGAVAEMQSTAIEQQDATAALTEAANAAVGMAKEADKR